MKTFIVVAVMLMCAGRGGAQAPGEAPDSCLVLAQIAYHHSDTVYWQGKPGSLFNEDSIKIDTCMVPDPFSETSRWFAKKLFEITFRYSVLSDSITSSGDTVDRDWRAIDTNYKETRSSLASIEQLFGHFTFHRQFSEPVDSSDLDARCWFLNFDHYVHVDSALYYLGGIEGLDTTVPVSWVSFLLWEASAGLVPSESKFVVWPQPCLNEVFIKGASKEGLLIYDALGRRITLPVLNLRDGVLSIDVTHVLPGFLFLDISGHVYKIIVQKSL